MEIPQKVKNRTALWSSDSTPGNLSEETPNHWVSKSLQHYLQSPRYGSSPSVHCRWVDKTAMGLLHNRILLGHKREENFTLCDSMDRPGEHYAKWNKPVRERQIP